MPEFTCAKCGVTKPTTEFWPHKPLRRGHFATCKACQYAYHRAWCRAHPERRLRQIAEAETRWRRGDPVAHILRRVKHRAKVTGLPFELTREDLVPLPTVCPVLGIPIGVNLPPSEHRSFLSLDRIDNTRGYVRGNVVIVSNRANLLKKDATVDELVKLARFYQDLAQGAETVASGASDFGRGAQTAGSNAGVTPSPASTTCRD
jgi:hypothetical protein